MVTDFLALDILQRYKKIDSITLKSIAIISMLIDHIGEILYPNISVFKYIGRIAFPIFAFQLVEGYSKTKNKKKYGLRLFIFALISEIPFDIAFYNSYFYWNHQNIFFELFLCFFLLIFLEKLEEQSVECKIILIFLFSLLSILLKFDYHAFGVLFVSLLYFYKDNIPLNIIGFIILSYIFIDTQELFGVLSFIPIMLYNGKLTNSNKRIPGYLKLSFYAFYPIHIISLYFIKLIL